MEGKSTAIVEVCYSFSTKGVTKVATLATQEGFFPATRFFKAGGGGADPPLIKIDTDALETEMKPLSIFYKYLHHD